MHNNKTSSRVRLNLAMLLAGLTAVLQAIQVQALPFVVNDDIVGVWNNSLVVAAAFRARDADKQLVGFNNAPEYPGAHGAVSTGDDGNLNYQKGDLVSAPLVYTTDLELRYQDKYGVYGKMRSWYDYAGENKNVPHGHIPNNYQPNAKMDDSDFYDYNQFSGYELLDMYVYGNWDIGENRLSARVGKQSINWGESLLFIGINGFNPLNFSALGRAGLRQDDALVPVNRIYTNLITDNGISLEAFYALDWESSRFPPCGSFVSTDLMLDSSCLLGTSALNYTDYEQLNTPALRNATVATLSNQNKPDGSGQYGLSSRYFVEPLDTEFGLYFVNYDATIPVATMRNCAPPVSGLPCLPPFGFYIPLEYQEDIKMYGISAATGEGETAFSAEINYVEGLEVQRNIPEMLAGALALQDKGIYAERMRELPPGAMLDGLLVDRTQLLLGANMDISRDINMNEATLVVETAWQWADLPGTDEERIGRNSHWGAATGPNGVCEQVTVNANGCKTDGFATEFSWGYRALFTFTQPLPGYGLEFQPRFAWSHDVEGYSVDATQVEGRQVFGATLRTIFQRRFFLDVGRTWFRADTDYDGIRDRDAYLIAAGLSF